jgi:hypothetical protein
LRNSKQRELLELLVGDTSLGCGYSLNLSRDLTGGAFEAFGLPHSAALAGVGARWSIAFSELFLFTPNPAPPFRDLGVVSPALPAPAPAAPSRWLLALTGDSAASAAAAEPPPTPTSEAFAVEPNVPTAPEAPPEAEAALAAGAPPEALRLTLELGAVTGGAEARAGAGG